MPQAGGIVLLAAWPQIGGSKGVGQAVGWGSPISATHKAPGHKRRFYEGYKKERRSKVVWKEEGR